MIPGISEQTKHAIKETLVLAGIAALAVVVDQLATVPVDTTSIVLTSAAAMALRILEGIRDGNRAKAGVVIPSDVGYPALQRLENPLLPTPVVVPGPAETLRVL